MIKLDNNGIFDVQYIKAADKRNVILQILDSWVETQGDIIFNKVSHDLERIDLDINDEAWSSWSTIRMTWDKQRRGLRHALMFIRKDGKVIDEDEMSRPDLTFICRSLGIVSNEAVYNPNACVCMQQD